MTNRQALDKYIASLQYPTCFVRPPVRVWCRPETRACTRCGAPYTISIPYTLCNPGARDLCDTCILKGVK